VFDSTERKSFESGTDTVKWLKSRGITRCRKTQRRRRRLRLRLSMFSLAPWPLDNKAPHHPTAVQGETIHPCAFPHPSLFCLTPSSPPLFSSYSPLLSFPANVASPTLHHAATARPMHSHYRNLPCCHNTFFAYFSCASGVSPRGARSLLSSLDALHRLYSVHTDPEKSAYRHRACI
jgi:hypothetical protein